jgi:hypothetical protein
MEHACSVDSCVVRSLAYCCFCTIIKETDLYFFSYYLLFSEKSITYPHHKPYVCTMTDFQITDADLTGFKGKVAVVTGNTLQTEPQSCVY